MVESYYQILEEFTFEEDEELEFSCDLNQISYGADLTLSDEDEEDDDQKQPAVTSYENDPDFEYESPSKKKRELPVLISKERMKEIIELWDRNPRWSWSTLKHKGASEIPSKRTLIRWRNQIRDSDNKLVKYRLINDYVFNELVEARKSFKIIRASHLRMWAMEKLAQLNDPKLRLKAGKSWVSRFKKAHNISSRKINRLVSKREVKSEDEILASAKRFQSEIQSLIPKYHPSHILNTDQCGFSYELTSSRTLTQKGEKTVYGYAQSPKNLSTHSYTVQYIISLSGEIMGNVFLCLQEPKGKFGPIVKKDVESYLPVNVTLTCSTSGKMSTSLNEYFIEKQVVPVVHDNFLYIVDSWTGHTGIDSYNKFFGEFNSRPEICLKIIPEKCTPLAQPLDTTFHRQLKNLAREILAALEVFVNVNSIDQSENWNTRKGIIKLQSLLHFMISAPIFKPMICYSWYSSGLTTEKREFLNVKQALFTFSSEDSLVCEICENEKPRFMKCAWCRKILCIQTLWLDNHFGNCENSPFKM